MAREVVSQKDCDESVMAILQENNKKLKRRNVLMKEEIQRLRGILQNIQGLLDISEMQKCEMEDED